MIEERYLSTGNQIKYKIIMVGDAGVGKTTIFWKYLEGQFLQQGTVTIIDFKIKQIKIDEQPIKLFIWDTAGSQKHRSIVQTYFKGCDGVILVFDLTKPNSFIEASTRWYEIAKSKSPDAQMLLVGNKSDLGSAVDQSMVQKWCKQHKIMYLKTSVKLDINVNQCFKMISEAIHKGPKQQKAKSFKLKRPQQAEKTKNKQCC